MSCDQERTAAQTIPEQSLMHTIIVSLHVHTFPVGEITFKNKNVSKQTAEAAWHDALDTDCGKLTIAALANEMQAHTRNLDMIASLLPNKRSSDCLTHCEGCAFFCECNNNKDNSNSPTTANNSKPTKQKRRSDRWAQEQNESDTLLTLARIFIRKILHQKNCPSKENPTACSNDDNRRASNCSKNFSGSAVMVVNADGDRRRMGHFLNFLLPGQKWSGYSSCTGSTSTWLSSLEQQAWLFRTKFGGNFCCEESKSRGWWVRRSITNARSYELPCFRY